MTNVISKIKLIGNLLRELIILVIISVVFITVMHFWGHSGNQPFWAIALFVFSLTKIYFLVGHTFKKMSELVGDNHSFNHILLLLSAVIALIVISFAFDYHCLSQIYHNAFSGVNYSASIYSRLANFLYFSIVTFTTVGYGDIVPNLLIVKFITILEMISSFVVIVFVISKYIKTK